MEAVPEHGRFVQVVGVNHHTASLDVREQLAVRPEQLEALTAHLRHVLSADECVFLGTCNRIELYVAGAGALAGPEALRALCDFTHADFGTVAPNSYALAHEECVRHLFRVAASLDSMVVGEAEILGQVKQAYAAATDIGGTGKVLNGLFQRAFSVAKEVRTDTAVGEGKVSVASVAVDFALRIFSSLAEKTILVIGAGEAAEGVVKALVDHGATAVLVANRTYDRAVALSKQYQGSAIRFDQLPQHLAQADIVIGSSAAPHPVVTEGQVRTARRRRRNRTMLFLDISTPRDIESTVGALDNVYLYDLDDLKDVVEEHLDLRSRELAAANEIVDRSVHGFLAELHAADVGPMIAAVRESWSAIRDAEVERALHRLNGVSEADRKEVEALADRLMNKLLHQPMRELRDAATEPDGHHILRAFKRLLHVDPTKRRS